MALFSCFTNVSIGDEQKLYYPTAIDGHERLAAVTGKMGGLLDQYRDLEDERGVDSGESYEYHYDLQTYAIDWCSAQDEIESRAVIDRLKQESGLFLGEFVKALLKINNIAAEFQTACEAFNEVALLAKLKDIPPLILKYVATNQSLYI